MNKLYKEASKTENNKSGSGHSNSVDKICTDNTSGLETNTKCKVNRIRKGRTSFADSLGLTILTGVISAFTKKLGTVLGKFQKRSQHSSLQELLFAAKYPVQCRMMRLRCKLRYSVVNNNIPRSGTFLLRTRHCE